MKKIDSKTKYFQLLFLLFLLLLASAILSIYVGAVDISPREIFQILTNKITGAEVFAPNWEGSTVSIIWQLRFPKVIGAICIGASLATTGIQMQALTKNPLADPFILGISSGASAGAVASILLGQLPIIGSFSVQAGASLGALLASGAIFLFSGRGRVDSVRLVLTGLALSSIFGALTNLLIFLAPDPRKVQSAMFWMTGSLSGIGWEVIPVTVGVTILALLISMGFHRHLDILLMGEERALSMGLDTGKLKKILIVLSSILTGVMVSISGVIGFVGLVIPHIVRSFLGSSHAKIIPVSAVLGGISILMGDTLARVAVRPEELPLGVITALAGAPFFLWLLQKTKIGFGD